MLGRLKSQKVDSRNKSLIDFEIYQLPKDPPVFTWLVDWTDAESAKETTHKLISFPSNQKFSSSVEQDIFLWKKVSYLPIN
ncbi:MAG: hypothetical protein ACI9DJ_002945 [Algoriphagus sp.]|jgi:hypothetical protein